MGGGEPRRDILYGVVDLVGGRQFSWTRPKGPEDPPRDRASLSPATTEQAEFCISYVFSVRIASTAVAPNVLVFQVVYP
ncbi:hypothetical protein FS749_008072, partial [Ceratobasidium sp. UAMH 11750]